MLSQKTAKKQSDKSDLSLFLHDEQLPVFYIILVDSIFISDSLIKFLLPFPLKCKTIQFQINAARISDLQSGKIVTKQSAFDGFWLHDLIPLSGESSDC